MEGQRLRPTWPDGVPLSVNAVFLKSPQTPLKLDETDPTLVVLGTSAIVLSNASMLNIPSGGHAFRLTGSVAKLNVHRVPNVLKSCHFFVCF